MGWYIANRSSFLQKEVVIRSWMCTTDNMFVFFPCSYDSVYYNCFIVALLIVHVLKQPFKASLKGTMKIKIKLKKTLVFLYFFQIELKTQTLLIILCLTKLFFTSQAIQILKIWTNMPDPIFFLCSRRKIIRRKDQSEACKIC